MKPLTLTQPRHKASQRRFFPGPLMPPALGKILFPRIYRKNKKVGNKLRWSLLLALYLPSVFCCSENSARIQLRLPSGKRLVRQLSAEETVEALYSWTAAELQKPHPLAWLYAQAEEDRAKHRTLAERACSDESNLLFDLLTIHPTETLFYKSHQTLEAAGLRNAVVVVKMQ